MGHICPSKWPPIPTAKQPWLGLTLLPWLQTYGAPTTLGLAKQPCPGISVWCQPHLGGACTAAWTIWLKSSHLPTVHHCCLDGHLPHIVWQPEDMAAGQEERQTEVHHEVQMAWCLNMLPGGMPGLKDVNSDKC